MTNEFGSIADQLITRGWTQGMIENTNGNVCLSGAILYAMNEADATSIDASKFDDELECSVRGVVAQLVGGSIAAWNDNPHRTFDEVLRVAKQADEIIHGEGFHATDATNTEGRSNA